MQAYEVFRIIVLGMCFVAMAAIIAGAWEHRCTERMMRKFIEEKIEKGDVDMHVVTGKDMWEDDGK